MVARKVALPAFHGGRPYATTCALLRGDAQPPCLVVERSKIIGGVGRTLRWSFTMGAHRDDQPATLLVSHIDDRAAFVAAASDGAATLASEIEYVDDPCDPNDRPFGWSCVLRVGRACDAALVAARLQRATACAVHLEDRARECTFEIGVERLDRSDFNFWGQSDDTAAPKQSWYKWDFSWLDPRWEVLPFTWRRLAMNLRDGVALDELPLPLRDHVAKLRLEAARAVGDDTAARALARRVPTRPRVTCALRPAQCRQLLACHYATRFCADDDDTFAEAQRLLTKYLFHGYTSRLFGPYNQQGIYVGRGLTQRKFKRLPQYHVDNLRPNVLNRMYQPDGSLVGEGRRPSRSKRHAPQPARRMRNDERYVARIRHRRRSSVDDDDKVVMDTPALV